MTLPLLIAGLILDLAGSHWFSGAGTVGLILIIVGALGLALQLLVFFGILGAALKR
ncbi:MAG: hypothetical protein ACYCQK_01855 [Acidiferrobacteraceae bacterium]